jgi:hypothetical protein
MSLVRIQNHILPYQLICPHSRDHCDAAAVAWKHPPGIRDEHRDARVESADIPQTRSAQTVTSAT